MDFLDYYQENLQDLRNLGAEFSKSYPKIARCLDLGGFVCKDPFVERVLEGCAFLAARTEKKLDDSYLNLIESLLTSMAPHVLTLLPLGSVLKLESGELHLLNDELPFGSRFELTLDQYASPLIFSSVFTAHLSSIEILSADYLLRGLDEFSALNPAGSSALTLEISINNAENSGDDVELYFNFDDDSASQLVCLMQNQLEGVFVRSATGTLHKLPRMEVALAVEGNEDNLLIAICPYLQGVLDLQLYLSYTFLYKFVRIKLLAAYVRKLNLERGTLVFLFNRRVENLRQSLKSGTILNNCVAVMNVFEKRSSRFDLNSSYRMRILADNCAPDFYEIFSVSSIDAYDVGNRKLFRALPFYRVDDSLDDQDSANFFSVHFQKRIVSANFDLKAVNRPLRDVYVSLSGPDYSENLSKLKSAAANLWCTNASIPKLVNINDCRLVDRTGRRGYLLFSPQGAERAIADKSSHDALCLLAYLRCDYSAVLMQDENAALTCLRSVLKQCSLRSEHETERLIEGLMSLKSRKRVFRLIKSGLAYFEPGFEVILTLSDQFLSGTGSYFLAIAVRSLVKSFTPLNTPLRFTLNTSKQGTIRSWNL